jgi:hypothetical protein
MPNIPRPELAVNLRRAHGRPRFFLMSFSTNGSAMMATDNPALCHSSRMPVSKILLAVVRITGHSESA